MKHVARSFFHRVKFSVLLCEKASCYSVFKTNFMNKANYIILLLSLAFVNCNGQSASDSILKQQIGQMLVVGFRGTELSPDNHIVSDIQQLNIGGVILFDYDGPSKSYNRNIVSVRQLKKLNQELQNLTNEKLIISIDQEGGLVNRLKPKYGFPASVSAEKLGKLNNEDSTKYYANLTAGTLKNAGFNVNFAPCVDVNINPNCPIIGGKERSFSGDSKLVFNNANWWLQEQQKMGIIGCVKHFPGHGSAETDTHLGTTDVTKTWKEEEILPYQELIKAGNTHMVMTSHIYNANLDEKYPATMSKAILTGILREQLKFEGVIITDDLAMGAMVKNYSFEEILEKAINAGANLLCLSNNGDSYDPQIAQKAVDTIFRLVKSGKIERKTIETSYTRIMKLKETL